MRATYLRAFVLAAALGAASCTSTVREGTGTSYLVISSMEAASGAEPGAFGGTLRSDVLTVVNNNPTIFNDVGRVRFQLALKDPGPSTTPNAPTFNQAITVDRYQVRYTRADGRNTPGVDVPYGFDGAITVTVVGAAVTEAGFEIVRHIAKQEAPLAALVRNAAVISTIAEVTFYGHDQTGHEVSVVGRMLIDFGNFGDPGA
jgi:hypothetical protein